MSPKLKESRLKIIQNGIPLAVIDRLKRDRETKKKRTIDICWIRGLSEVYQFEYFLELLKEYQNYTHQKLMYI